jgi:acetyl esterase/lipase
MSHERLSIRSRIVKAILRTSNSKTKYTISKLDATRRNFETYLSLMTPSTPLGVGHRTIAGIDVDIVTPRKPTKRVVIYLHGGGFIMGSPRSYRQHLKRISRTCDARVYAIKYSLAPEAPYPHALDEIQRVWKELLSSGEIEPDHAVFVGDSAGGNLCIASLLRYRDQEIAMPASIALLSPFLDLTLSGASYVSRRKRDPLLTYEKVSFFANAYTTLGERTHPLISPIFASLKGLPPTLIHVGDDEILLDDAQTIATNAVGDGVDVQLEVMGGMWHGWHILAPYVPEAKNAMCRLADFIIAHS